MRTGLVVAAVLVLLLQACAVARWQVPVQPLRGQDEARVEQDRRQCDNEAKTSSGYSRAVEAKTWLWGIFIMAPAVLAEYPFVMVEETAREVASAVRKGDA